MNCVNKKILSYPKTKTYRHIETKLILSFLVSLFTFNYYYETCALYIPDRRSYSSGMDVKIHSSVSKIYICKVSDLFP